MLEDGRASSFFKSAGRDTAIVFDNHRLCRFRRYFCVAMSFKTANRVVKSVENLDKSIRLQVRVGTKFQSTKSFVIGLAHLLEARNPFFPECPCEWRY